MDVVQSGALLGHVYINWLNLSVSQMEHQKLTLSPFINTSYTSDHSEDTPLDCLILLSLCSHYLHFRDEEIVYCASSFTP